MSLLNKVTYHVLLLELFCYVITLMPLSFLSVSMKQTLYASVRTLLSYQVSQWILRLILLIILTVLGDTLIRLHRLETEPQNILYSPLDLSAKTSLFYTHRNLYLSLFTLVMALVLYRRCADLSVILDLQQRLTATTTNVTTNATNATNANVTNANANQKETSVRHRTARQEDLVGK